MSEQQKEVSRRDFLGTVALASVAGAALLSCSKKPAREYTFPPLLEKAPEGRKLKAGLIGCGNRGTGAALNFLSAGPGLEIAAMADVFADRLASSRKRLKEKAGVEVPDSRCFLGFDAYKKVLDSGVDLVILATPPHFRPEHFAAAVDARKHVFMEKPVAVDPVGARSIIDTATKARALGLSVVTGTQRRHQREYIATFKRILDGAIGDIVAARAYWLGGQVWYRERKPGWSDMEYMIRDWVNWRWLSGDHIVEQNVHNIDVINWFLGDHPVKAIGFGARMRRVTGDQYDFFSVDFVYNDEIHLHDMARQINGCANNVSEWVIGTKGYANCRGTIYKPDGTVAWQYEGVKINPYVQEHIDLVTSIRTEKPFVEAENTAISTLTAILGREAAYTGKEITWDEIWASNMRLGPMEYAMGPVDIEVKIPVPGTP
ncbi:MAG: Gfo/Idh/MocA family oxidoreductase [Calditrichaeota bacterium]|nr:Gfo/Idh/MocA family oxidoreductase [Calditrichota bacterium]